jgi:outer membrane protein OmpA-like peptidoglycan-associated protein
MYHRTLIALSLAAALALPVLAQQSSSSSSQPQSTAPAATDTTAQPSTMQSTPPAATDQSQQPAQAAQPASSDNNAANSSATANSNSSNLDHQPLAYQRHEGFWGKLNPFARKKYVHRQMDPVRDRVNELDELTSANSKMIKDVDSRATEGVRLASAKANEADQHAVDAGSRAQLAHQTAQQATARLQTVEKVVTNIDQFQPVSQTEIRFRPGQMALSQKAKSALDELATPLKEQKGYVVEVQGFSSGKGQVAIGNSQRMAESVVRYLVINHDIPVYRIYTVGMGNAPVTATNTEGKKPRRTIGGRVEISLLKNGIGDLNAEPAGSPANTAIGGGNANSAPLPQSDQDTSAQPASGSATPANSSSSKPQTAQPQSSQPAPAPQQQETQTPKN